MSALFEEEKKLSALLIDDGSAAFCYKGCTFALDLADEETLSRIEACAKWFAKEKVEDIGAYCGVIRRFLSEVLGEGAGEKLLGRENNLRAAHNCFVQLLRCMFGQLEDMREAQAAALLAFSPGRAERMLDGTQFAD